MLLIGMLCAFSVLLTLHAAVVLSIVMCRLVHATVATHMCSK